MTATCSSHHFSSVGGFYFSAHATKNNHCSGASWSPPTLKRRVQNSSDVTLSTKLVTLNGGRSSQPFPCALFSEAKLPLPDFRTVPAFCRSHGLLLDFLPTYFMTVFSLSLLPCDSLTQAPRSLVCLRTENGFIWMVVKVLPKAQGKETPKLSPGFWYFQCLFNPARENMKPRLPTFILWISEHWATLTPSIFLQASCGTLCCCRHQRAASASFPCSSFLLR